MRGARGTLGGSDDGGFDEFVELRESDATCASNCPMRATAASSFWVSLETRASSSAIRMSRGSGVATPRIDHTRRIVVDPLNAYDTGSEIGGLPLDVDVSLLVPRNATPYVVGDMSILLWSVFGTPIEISSLSGANRPTCKRLDTILGAIGASVDRSDVYSVAAALQVWRNQHVDYSGRTIDGTDGDKVWALADGSELGHCKEGSLLMEQALRLLGVDAQWVHVLATEAAFPGASGKIPPHMTMVWRHAQMAKSMSTEPVKASSLKGYICGLGNRNLVHLAGLTKVKGAFFLAIDSIQRFLVR